MVKIEQEISEKIFGKSVSEKDFYVWYTKELSVCICV